LKFETFVHALDNKNIIPIIKLTRNNKNIDLISVLYNNNLLTKNRLEFIVEKCMKYLEIPTALVKKIWENNDTDLLYIILNYFNFYDNECIIQLLSLYKNANSKNTLKRSEFNQLIEKYKTSVKFPEYRSRNGFFS
jgi:hypothetical protein